MLDPGSQTSFITETAAQLLRLKRTSISTTITTLGNSKREASKGMVSITIQSRSNPLFTVNVKALIMSKITSLLPSASTKNWKHINSLELADPYYYHPGNIDILLGADVSPEIMLEGLILGPTGTPMAQKTQLGWVISGKTTTQIEVQSYHNKINIDDFKQFWEIEETPSTKPLNKEEEECEQIFVKTYRRNPEGRFIVTLPFKEPPEHQLGNSKCQAIQRFLQLEKRFQRYPEISKQYKDVINEYLELGHMTAISESFEPNSSYYLPHHSVIKESSTTTKMRVVFDASAKSTSGKSLNDILHVGPSIQQDLASIMLRWRKHKIIISADIEKMFRQIIIDHKDTQYQRIIWRESPLESLKCYELKTVTFGMASASYLAIRSLSQLAIESKDNFQLASKTILRDFYVDDLFTGADSVKEAIVLQRELTSILRGGGFELRKWISNSNEVLGEIPDKLREINFPLNFEFSQTVKTLGILYHPAIDCFQFKITQQPLQTPPTKRNMLSESSKLFDPLGWLAPVIVKVKILLQELWKEELEWDDILSGSILKEWLKLRQDLTNLETIKIPRWVGYHYGIKAQIHGFCDASESAYAAVIYTRFLNSNGTINVNMLISKSKVAPIQTISLPRLELCAALLLAKLMKHTQESLEIDNFTMYTWTDSAIVLAWIKNSPTKWKTFVANRVAQIQQLLTTSQWRHIQSSENPADCASRGIFPAELKNHNLWWTGPSWLAKPESTWPTSKIDIETTNFDAKRNSSAQFTSLHVLTTSIEDILENFCSLSKATRVIASCRRFINNCRISTQQASKQQKERLLCIDYSKILPFSNSEIRNTLLTIIKSTQLQYFDKDIINLQTQRQKQSNLSTLNPFIDNQNVLRVGGRLENATIPYEQKHPIIIPKQSRIALLIVQDAHLRTQHGGTQLTLHTIRHRYWIIQARNQVKQFINKCITCLRFRKSVNNQIMGNLPSVRLEYTRPFVNVGVDYAGPLDLKASKLRTNRTYKAYIALFVCLTTRAIHIEVVSDLTSNTFLAALDRFSARRGYPHKIYSDNGTNFVGADRAIKKTFVDMLKDPIIPNSLVNHRIEWHFIPPKSPHFGGIWEAGVKSFKSHFRRIVGKALLTYEEIVTVTTRIEACLNSRPLTRLTDDPNDLSALTPGHFLIGGEIIAPPTEDLLNTNSNHISRWKLLQKIQQEFWRRWSNEYLHTLQQRVKWMVKKEEVKVGDLVLFKEDDQPPLNWKLCRVQELIKGADNYVRVVKLKTATGFLNRPIVKIIPLPLT